MKETWSPVVSMWKLLIGVLKGRMNNFSYDPATATLAIESEGEVTVTRKAIELGDGVLIERNLSLTAGHTS
jgi:hypothetical protein